MHLDIVLRYDALYRCSGLQEAFFSFAPKSDGKVLIYCHVSSVLQLHLPIRDKFTVPNPFHTAITSFDFLAASSLASTASTSSTAILTRSLSETAEPLAHGFYERSEMLSAALTCPSSPSSSSSHQPALPVASRPLPPRCSQFP